MKHSDEALLEIMRAPHRQVAATARKLGISKRHAYAIRSLELKRAWWLAQKYPAPPALPDTRPLFVGRDPGVGHGWFPPRG